jgi:hypothetical protein
MYGHQVNARVAGCIKTCHSAPRIRQHRPPGSQRKLTFPQHHDTSNNLATACSHPGIYQTTELRFCSVPTKLAVRGRGTLKALGALHYAPGSSQNSVHREANPPAQSAPAPHSHPASCSWCECAAPPGGQSHLELRYRSHDQNVQTSSVQRRYCRKHRVIQPVLAAVGVAIHQHTVDAELKEA